MTWVFHSIEPLAGYLQLPYFAWVSFASVLNYTLLKLNTKTVSNGMSCITVCQKDKSAPCACLELSASTALAETAYDFAKSTLSDVCFPGVCIARQHQVLQDTAC